MSTSSTTAKKPKAESSGPAPKPTEGKDVKDQKAAPAESKGPEIPVVRNENFDLDGYAAGYNGHTKVKRLLFIAERCPDVQVKAFRMAIDELKKGTNSNLYLEAVSRAREVLIDKLGDEWGLDQNWVKNVNRVATEQQTRLEVDLNNQKRDQEREPTRKAFENLGNFFMQRGEFTQALTNYTTMKDYCANNRQTLDMCLAVIKASIQAGSLSYVNTHAGRAKNLPEIDSVTRSQVNSALGLYALKSSNYQGAAERFLEVSVDMKDRYKDVITTRDVAIYGALCALASYSRADLKTRVANNIEFKKLLEQAPGWRQIVQNFTLSNYAACFAALERAKPDLMLDMYLAPHVERLIVRIRDRALIQYFKPFVSVKIPAMAAAFKLDVPALERQLVNLIADNLIQARIDSANKILYARHADQRTATYQQAMNLGTRYVRDVKSLLLRMSLVEHNFVVKAPDTRKRRGDDDDEEKQGPRDRP